MSDDLRPHAYLAHWGLDEPPFLLAPDARFAFERHDHQEGLARLLFGLTQLQGTVAITGEIGCGKTTLVRVLTRALAGDGFAVATLANPPRTGAATLRAMLEALEGPAPRGSAAELARRLRGRVAEERAAGRRVVLVIDEAQRLDARALEEVRLLTNPAGPDAGDGAAPVVLLGQPELAGKIDALPQLAQRVVVRYHLGAMAADETAAYLAYRARVAGARRQLFSDRAIRVLHAESGGIPRVVNMIAANALFVAFSRGEDTVGADTLLDVAEDRRGGTPPHDVAPGENAAP